MPEKKPFFVTAVVNYDLKLNFIKSFISEIPVVEFNSANLQAQETEGKIIQAQIPLAFMRSNRFIQFVTHNLQVRAYKHNGSYRSVYWPA